jgi:hypothetical protein
VGQLVEVRVLSAAPPKIKLLTSLGFWPGALHLTVRVGRDCSSTGATCACVPQPESVLSAPDLDEIISERFAGHFSTPVPSSHPLR